MKSYKWLLTSMVIPMLLLAACSGTNFSLGTTSNVAAPVAVAGIAAPAVVLPQVTTPGDLTAFQSTLEEVYQNVNPSVVNVQVVESASASSSQSNNPFGRNPFGNNPGSQGPAQALGSGFVWDTQGHIITNNHVVDGASSIQVTFSDGMTVDAKVVGTDPNADLAVLQVNVPASQLTPVVLADSTQVKVGQIAIAIGNPYGLAGTMTEGIISGLERTLPVGLDNLTSQQGPTYSIPDIIQTDASINPGNSGGVLVDIQGQLIGVTAAIESSSGSNSGIGFVIPSAIVKKVVPSLIATGSYQHPRLGISGTSMTPDLAKAMGLDSQQNGALVIEVTPGGPAANAGLQASNQTATINGQNVPVGGDVIVAINGQSVKQFDDLSTYLFYNTSIGQTVNLTVLRNGKEQTVKVTLDALPNQ
jgi:2-alkenal reductase